MLGNLKKKPTLNLLNFIGIKYRKGRFTKQENETLYKALQEYKKVCCYYYLIQLMHIR